MYNYKTCFLYSLLKLLVFDSNKIKLFFLINITEMIRKPVTICSAAA